MTPLSREGTHVALASGGMDSAVAAHVAVRWGPCDVLVYLDTGTGLDENERYVREELAPRLGVQYACWRTHEDYEDRVREHGFPGASRHSIMYRSLKERQLQKWAAKLEGDVHYWTGVRSTESERRMRTVEPEDDHAGGRWYWRAPIHDWTKEECRRYVDRFDIPENDLWSSLGRSGDCFCGAFASREELLDLEAAGFETHAEWLRELEEDVVDEHGKHGRWAWSSMNKSDHADADDLQMTLCSSCGVPVPDGGSEVLDP